MPSLADDRLVVLAVGIALLGTTLAGSGFAAQDDAFDIAIPGSVETPPETVTFQSETYEISAIGRLDSGDALQVDVDAPAGASYDVYLYNADRKIVDFEEASGDDTVQFPTDGYDPGSYVVVVEHDGSYEAVHPLVLSDYAVSVTAPGEASPDETIEVSADVTADPGENPIDRVRVIVGDEEDRVNGTMSEGEDGTYRASVSLSDLPPGEYRLYVIVQGSDEVYGQGELLGVSDSQDMSIVEDTPTRTPTRTEANGGGSGNGDGGDGGNGGSDGGDGDSGEDGSTGEITQTATQDGAGATGDSTTTSPSTESSPVTTAATTTASTPATAGVSTTTDGAGANVISPSGLESETPGTGTVVSPGQPLGYLPVVFAVVLVILLVIAASRADLV